MNTIDRQLQLQILKRLSEVYPLRSDPRQWNDLGPGLKPNLVYLEEHGLVELNKSELDMFTDILIHGAKITHEGVDFLADDGGLSAVLGVVTVKLHDETIKQLIEAKIQASTLPSDEKSRITLGLRKLPADATKHLVLKLLDLGLEKGPEAILAIQKLLTHWGH